MLGEVVVGAVVDALNLVEAVGWEIVFDVPGVFCVED